MNKKCLTFVSLFLGLIMVFTAILLSACVNVYADDTNQGDTKEVVEEPNATEVEEELVVETELTEEEKEKINEYLNEAIEGLVVVSTGDYNTMKAWAVGIVGGETAVLLLALILLVRLIMKRYKESSAYEKALSKLDAENQKRVVDTEKRIDDKLEKLQIAVENRLDNDKADKKAEAEQKAAAINNIVEAALNNLK